MNPMVTVHINGLDQLKKALEQLPIDLQGKPAVSAVSAGARLIRNQAIKNAEPHRSTGTLEKNIVIAQTRRKYPGKVEYSVGIRKIKKKFVNNARNRKLKRVGKTYYVYGEAYYWRFLEFGTSKYNKTPFLVPAFESKKMAAIDLIKKRLAIGIEKLAEKWRIKP